MYIVFFLFTIINFALSIYMRDNLILYVAAISFITTICIPFFYDTTPKIKNVFSNITVIIISIQSILIAFFLWLDFSEGLQNYLHILVFSMHFLINTYTLFEILSIKKETPQTEISNN